MPPPGANPEGVKDLGLEEITDAEKRKQVEDYFKSRPDLLSDIMHEKKKAREVLSEKIKEYNRTQLQTQQIIEGIIQELQKDSMERDLNEGYTDKSGQAHDSYIEQFHKEVERVKVDVEGEDADRNNPVRQACLNEVIKTIRAIPPYVKRAYRHEYVEDMIRNYVKEMDKHAENMIKWGVLRIDDLKDFHPKTFQEWAKEPGRPQESEMIQKFDAAQAKEFVQTTAGAKDTLAKINDNLATLPPENQEYFKKGVKDIEGFVADNPAGASEAAQKLLEEATAAAGMVALANEIRTKAGETKDEALKKKYTDLSAKIDANLKAAPSEKDPNKRKNLLDLASLQNEKSQIDTESPSTPATPPEEEEPEFFKDPKAWLKYQMGSFKKIWEEIVGFLGAVLGFFGIKSSLTSGADKGAETPKQQEARKFLVDKFKLTEDESKKFGQIKLGEFLKISSPPDWLDKSRFESLQKAVTFNKKSSDKEEVLLLDFLAERKNDWKEPPDKTAGK